MKNFKLKHHFFSALAVGFFLLLAFGSDDDKSSSSSSSSSTSSEPEKKVVPKMTEEEYINYFQAKWDSVKLYKESGFPQYDTYTTALGDVLNEMVTVLERDNPQIDLVKSPDKLNKLRLKFIDGKKYSKAMKDFFTYGQPIGGSELKYACESFLKDNANDPSSIDIEDYQVKGQSKNGWIVAVKYRGKNAFGGLVLNVSTFDVRYNPTDKFYYAVNAY